MARDYVTIVSGLPRSGTSMMMQMLEAGGIPILTDKQRVADEDNPKGYYEFERVKQVTKDQAWLEDSRGKAVKMVSALLKDLPPGYHYKIVFMRRKMDEILKSQSVMLARSGKSADIPDDKMAALFQQHLDQVMKWLPAQPNIDVLYIHYNDVMQNPSQEVEKLVQFLGSDLDANAMVGVVDKALYRERR